MKAPVYVYYYTGANYDNKLQSSNKRASPPNGGKMVAPCSHTEH